LTVKPIRPIAARQLSDARDMMVHCAQETDHPAGILPELYEWFGNA